jgi:D-xylose transport system substrate-binding protein
MTRSKMGREVRHVEGRLRSSVLAAASVLLAVGFAACGHAVKESDGETSGSGDLTIGLLLPENQTARYEQFDRPLIEKKIKELCDDCAVDYANARNDVITQIHQVDAMITNGADVLILDCVDYKPLRSAVIKAKKAGIPVIAYDREVEGPVSAFVSYAPEKIGRLQGEMLLEAMGRKADGGQIIRVEGPIATQADPREKGGLSVLKGRVKIGKVERAPEWNAERGYDTTSRAIADVGANHVDAVWSGNDALAAGAIAALKAAHIKPLPPVVAQDAELGAVQRIISGEQYSSVYKPYKPEAYTAAQMAVTLGRGEKLGSIAKDKVSTPTTKGIPAVLLTPVPLTVDNVRDTVIKDGMYTIDQVCTSHYHDACKKAGLTQ